jgi:hypothetical protein
MLQRCAYMLQHTAVAASEACPTFFTLMLKTSSPSVGNPLLARLQHPSPRPL